MHCVQPLPESACTDDSDILSISIKTTFYCAMIMYATFPKHEAHQLLSCDCTNVYSTPRTMWSVGDVPSHPSTSYAPHSLENTSIENSKVLFDDAWQPSLAAAARCRRLLAVSKRREARDVMVSMWNQNDEAHFIHNLMHAHAGLAGHLWWASYHANRLKQLPWHLVVQWSKSMSGWASYRLFGLNSSNLGLGGTGSGFDWSNGHAG